MFHGFEELEDGFGPIIYAAGYVVKGRRLVDALTVPPGFRSRVSSRLHITENLSVLPLAQHASSALVPGFWMACALVLRGIEGGKLGRTSGLLMRAGVLGRLIRTKGGWIMVL